MKTGMGVGLRMVLMILPRDTISNQREVVYFSPGLLIFKDISQAVCIWLSREGYLGMKGVDIQPALEFPGKQQRGGLKRHFPAHQDCHNTSSFQSTLSLSQQIFKPFEGKREMRRPQEPSLVQHSLDCLLSHHPQPGISERPTSGDGCEIFSRLQTQKGASLPSEDRQPFGYPLVT